MVLDIKWKCGDCGREFDSNEFMTLPVVKAVDSDSLPALEHGYVPVCYCGYRFHRDRWRTTTEVVFVLNWFQSIKAQVSTAFLELEHSGGWYETMIFLDSKNYSCYFLRRYKTRAEARKGHDEIVKFIRENGKGTSFKLDKKNKEIKILL